jgi:signal transduction histidine kinase
VLSEDGDNYRITSAATLDDAVTRSKDGAFDVVLLDLGLPDAEGTEALLRVSEATPATPIVVLSGREDLDLALETMRLGAQDYLVKGQSEHPLLTRAIRYAIERKRMQDSLAAAREDAERANAVKDDFLAMLGHELRNPLSPIVTALMLMRERPGAEAMQRELDIVDRQVEHVVRLVDDLLDVSRISRGKLAIHRDLVDLADIVSDAVEIARPLIESRQHQLTNGVPRGQLFIDGDRSRLAQVVTNLLTNAGKYTNPDGTIAVTAVKLGRFVELSVRDNGMGMPADFVDRVFDTFRQGTQSLARSSGGLGLGLSIVKSLVTLHGGTVRARSDGLGRGSEFVIRLPLDIPDWIDSDNPAERPLPEHTTIARRILIVDDNEDGAEMLAAGLDWVGHTTRTAYDGPTALEVAKEFQPEVALLDIGLPGMNGYELATRIREMFGERAPLLVAVTGYGQADDRAQARAAGFARHFVKPVDIRKLQEMFAALPERS